MRNMNKTFSQRGTLLMEAIAMLGLIAMVTPTLYKKSAERMQEIQDINIASQARNMDHIISSFIYNHLSDFKGSSGIDSGETIELCYNGKEEGGENDCFAYGYSSYVPAGYTPRNLKTYGEPRIYVYRYGDSTNANLRDSFVYYIIYPNISNQDEKRATRVASLVGANGGTILERNGVNNVYGTGGGWGLDNTLIGDEDGQIDIPEDLITKNSLVITSQEPVTADVIDSEVFLYRKFDEPIKNTMYTSLYMGGVDLGDGTTNSQNRLNSIYNVRKLTLNTRCTPATIRDGSSSDVGPESTECPATVADLYIGKPRQNTDVYKDRALIGAENTGAAWIYGNLSALNENFKLVKGSSSETETIPDAMMFGRYDNSGTSSDVFYAVNGAGSSKVALINGFMQVQSGSGESSRVFMVGNSSAEDAFIGVYEGSSTVRINSPTEGTDDASRETRINTAGGTVYIGGRSLDNLDMRSDVIINNEGGSLVAGPSGAWIYAGGNFSSDAEVHVLKDRLGEFSVGGSTEASVSQGLIFVNSSVVGLYDGQIQVFRPNSGVNVGGISGEQLVSEYGGSPDVGDNGATAILSQYTNILGSTYMGRDSMNHANEVLGENFNRNEWNLAVAGSAYVDSTLAAYEAWFHRSGFKDLHAGFSSFAEWKNGDEAAKEKATLNVYEDRLVVRNRTSDANDDLGDFGNSTNTGVVMYADSSHVRLQSTHGAALDLNGELAQFGSGTNVVSADYSTGVAIKTDGDSSYSVNIQENAMVFKGHPGNMEAYPTNTIEAQAGEFKIRAGKNSDQAGGAQFIVNNSSATVHQADFKVSHEASATSSRVAFYVAPARYDGNGMGTTDSEGNATVNINGSLHVKGNEVIHIASDSSNAAGEKHAMLEINPDFVQVYKKNSSGAVDNSYKVMKINPYDVGGEESNADEKMNVGVYIRRGAIELEASNSSEIGMHAANAGYGYILASRFVYNGSEEVPEVGTITGYTSASEKYDQYMVNPAYTSVMHDIKLTTRGGARLSDVLPDYVLKGVYNLSNNCPEGETNDVRCENTGMDMWAAPYVGIIPYASCPPGYLNMTTIMPISFNVGRAGRLVSETRDGQTRWVVGSGRHQAEILNAADYPNSGSSKIMYPGMVDVNSYVYNGIYQGPSSFSFSSYVSSRPEGWFLGVKAPLNAAGTGTDAELEAELGASGEQHWKYRASQADSNWKTLAEPLYFQQNTWLKTTVNPDTKGWKAYMGFIYDVNEWIDLGGEDAPVGNIFEKDGENNTGLQASQFKWNVFPVPINTIEGHAMVYCYFDRNNAAFNDASWNKLIDKYDQLEGLKNNDNRYRDVGVKPDGDYTRRLRDPSLKYNDPW